MTDKKSTNWLDEAGIIGYNPIINPPETRDLFEDSLAESQRASSETKQLTPILTKLDELAPCYVLERLISMQGIVQGSLNTLGSELSLQTFVVNGQTLGSSQFQSWLKDAIYQTEKYQQLLEWRSEIYSQTKTDFEVEIFEQISLALSELEKVTAYFKNIMYSSERSIEEQVNEEQKTIQRLKSLEVDGEIETINYAAISADVRLSDATLRICQAIYRYALRLFNYWQNDVEWQPSYDCSDEELEALSLVFENYVRTQNRNLTQLERSLKRSFDGSLFADFQNQKEKFLKVLSQKQKLGEALQDNTSLAGYYELEENQIHSILVNLYKYAEFANMAYDDLFKAFTEKEKLRQIFKA